MRVMVTGASGNIGSRACVALLDAGHNVVATDITETNPISVPLHIADLRDRDAMAGLFDGIDAVVHLGNRSSFRPRDTQIVFNENIAMNTNVFQGAVDAGVRRLIFASSIQVVLGEVYPARTDGEMQSFAYLPMDGDMPADPPNPYGLSKQVGEVMLSYLARRYDPLSAVALRFPMTVPEPRPQPIKREAFTYLTCGDAGRLICAILASDLPGFRVYLPANTRLPEGMSAAETIRQIYPDAELRRPIEQIDSLADVSRITADTGWTPEDHVIP